MQLTDDEKKAREIIVREVENAILLLQNHLQKFCDNQNTASVPMNHIRTAVKLLLEGYKKGASDDTSEDTVRQG